RRDQPLLAALLRPFVQVVGEVAFEGAPDLVAVGAEPLERLLDVLRQQRLGQRRVLVPRHGLPGPSEDAAWTTDGEERRPARDGGRLARRALDLRRDVDRRP